MCIRDRIYSVSTDTHFTHKAWHDTSETIKKINYVMVGDPTGVISRNFEVMIEASGLADRGTFVVDPDGKIQILEVNAGGVGRSATELLRKVKAAQYVASHPGEVCPAKWEEGDATLAPGLDQMCIRDRSSPTCFVDNPPLPLKDTPLEAF